MRMLSLALLALAACNGKADDTKKNNAGEADIVGILITPESVILPIGEQVQLKATGLTDAREARDLTNVVEWDSSDDGVAEISNKLDEEGIIVSKGTGETSITAELDGIESVSLRVRVTDADLEELTVEPAGVTLGVDQDLQLVANAKFSDNTVSDATAQVRWITKDGDIVRFAEPGLLRGAGVGTTTVESEWLGVSSKKVDVEVVAKASIDLEVSDVDAVAGDGIAVIEFAISNNGSAGASGFWVDAFVGGSKPSVGDYGDVYGQISYLAPKTSEVYYLQAEGISDGNHTIWVLADSTGALEEDSESNNVDSTTVTATSSTPVLADLTATIDAVADNEFVYYEIVVDNQGDAPSGDFYVDLYIDRGAPPQPGDFGAYYELVNSLGPGEMETVEFLVEEYCISCTSWVLADSEDTVEESKENNNTDSVDVGSFQDTGYWK